MAERHLHVVETSPEESASSGEAIEYANGRRRERRARRNLEYDYSGQTRRSIALLFTLVMATGVGTAVVQEMQDQIDSKDPVVVPADTQKHRKRMKNHPKRRHHAKHHHAKHHPNKKRKKGPKVAKFAEGPDGPLPETGVDPQCVKNLVAEVEQIEFVLEDLELEFNDDYELKPEAKEKIKAKIARFLRCEINELEERKAGTSEFELYYEGSQLMVLKGGRKVEVYMYRTASNPQHEIVNYVRENGKFIPHRRFADLKFNDGKTRSRSKEKEGGREYKDMIMIKGEDDYFRTVTIFRGRGGKVLRVGELRSHGKDYKSAMCFPSREQEKEFYESEGL